MKESVRYLFRTFLDTAILPRQQKTAKVVPLKRPNKNDYIRAKVWRPVPMLSTLSKLLAAFILKRMSFAVETGGLLPTHPFGAWIRRSAEQALLLLGEHIYTV